MMATSDPTCELCGTTIGDEPMWDKEHGTAVHRVCLFVEEVEGWLGPGSPWRVFGSPADDGLAGDASDRCQ